MKSLLERYGIEVAAILLVASLGVHSLVNAYYRVSRPATVKVLGKDGKESSVRGYKDNDGTLIILESEFNAPATQ